MKKVFIFLITTTVCMLSYAQQTANLVLFTEGGEKFTLFFNGVQQNETPQSNVKVEGITSAMGQVKVVFEEPGAPELSKPLMVQFGQEMTAMIRKNNKGKYKFGMVALTPLTTSAAVDEVVVIQQTGPQGNQQVIRDMSGPISATVEGNNILLEDGRTFTWKHVDLNWAGVKVEVLEPVGAKVIISYDGAVAYESEAPCLYDEKDWNKNNAYVKIEIQEANKSWSVKLKNSNGYKIVIDDGGSSSGTRTSTTSRTVSSVCSQSISSADFSSAKNSINNQSFSDSKMSVAKQVVKNNCFTVGQIKELMGLFSYEEQKLELAKLAYPRTINKQDYYQVNDVFSFSSSVDDLNAFLSGQ